jgi:hypothetical protein
MLDEHVEPLVVGNDVEIAAGISCCLHSDLASEDEIKGVLRGNGCPDQLRLLGQPLNLVVQLGRRVGLACAKNEMNDGRPTLDSGKILLFHILVVDIDVVDAWRHLKV